MSTTELILNFTELTNAEAKLALAMKLGGGNIKAQCSVVRNIVKQLSKV